MLSIVNARVPVTVDELHPEERRQLEAVFDDGLEEALGKEEVGIEVAEVHDDNGVLVYRMYGWNYGVGYLFPPTGVAVVAFGSQHEAEHWNVAQRPLFQAMDEALRERNDGFDQDLTYCWKDDSCWDDIAGLPPGTVGSEPTLRERLDARDAARARR